MGEANFYYFTCLNAEVTDLCRRKSNSNF